MLDEILNFHFLQFHCKHTTYLTPIVRLVFLIQLAHVRKRVFTVKWNRRSFSLVFATGVATLLLKNILFVVSHSKNMTVKEGCLHCLILS